MELNGKLISLLPYTLERCHEFYRQYVSDPCMTDEEFKYDKQRVDAYFQKRARDPSRRMFAIMLGNKTIGEIQLKYIDFTAERGTLSIILANDSVKNKGYGTEAEALLINYAFRELELNAVLADAVHRNERSKHLLEKLGFIYDRDDDTFDYYILERS